MYILNKKKRTKNRKKTKRKNPGKSIKTHKLKQKTSRRSRKSKN